MTLLLLLARLVSAQELAPLPCTACTLEAATRAAGLSYPPPAVRIEIDKSERSLVLWSGDQALKRYRVGLGDPVGDKQREGDRKTPIGSFRVVTRNSKSAFHLFLGLGYPNAEDADRGLKAGLITQAQAQRIREASRAGRVPPWDTALGGAIGIHGGGGDSDWTLGCIAVSNAEIEELWAVTRHGTRVRITD